MNNKQNTMPRSWVISLEANTPRNITPNGESAVLSTDFLIQNNVGQEIKFGGDDSQDVRVIIEFDWAGIDRDLSSTASFTSSDKIFLLSPIDGDVVILASVKEL